MDAIYTKYKISKTKIINLVGMFHSSYYWRPRFGKKGTKSSKLINPKSKGLGNQNMVSAAVKIILSHQCFISSKTRILF